jgi:hypothetical protein
MAGIGMMSGANTREDYEAAALPEHILVLHNTFVHNDHHISGGACVLVVNNLFVDARQVALKGLVHNSLVRRNLLWGKNDETTGMQPLQDAIREPPGFADSYYRLDTGSAAIDAGLRQVRWLGKLWTPAPPAEIRGRGPDLGGLEHWVGAEL